MALPVTENPPICCFWFTGEQAWWLILFVILFPSPFFILFAATFEAIAIALYFITSDLPAASFAGFLLFAHMTLLFILSHVSLLSV